MTTGKERLIQTLFENNDKKLLNIKFFRTEGLGSVSEEQFCEKVKNIIFKIDNELTDSSGVFSETHIHRKDVNLIS